MFLFRYRGHDYEISDAVLEAAIADLGTVRVRIDAARMGTDVNLLAALWPLDRSKLPTFELRTGPRYQTVSSSDVAAMHYWFASAVPVVAVAAPRRSPPPIYAALSCFAAAITAAFPECDPNTIQVNSYDSAWPRSVLDHIFPLTRNIRTRAMTLAMFLPPSLYEVT